MAYDYSKIDVPKIEGVADQMSQLNGQLREKLEEARRLIEQLSNIWEGQAAQETISGFNSFAKQYFDSFEEQINGYVSFLKQAAQGYDATEQQNTALSDAFK